MQVGKVPFKCLLNQIILCMFDGLSTFKKLQVYTDKYSLFGKVYAHCLFLFTFVVSRLCVGKQ